MRQGRAMRTAHRGGYRPSSIAITLLVAAAALLAAPGRAAGGPDSAAAARPLTGNPGLDLFGMRTLEQGPKLVPQQGAGDATEPARKSVILGAGLSLLVPGAGEFYAQSYWKAALFIALEAAAWGVAYHWDKRGDRQSDSYQKFADDNWSVVRYAEYAQKHWTEAAAYRVVVSNDPALPAWQRVDWGELNRMERAVAGTALGMYYSHSLPVHGDQQYYEMIGKYPQFNQGWSDARDLPNDYETIKGNLTANFQYYSGERGKANTYYERATTFVTVAIINHVISAVDAAFTTAAYNRSLHAQVGILTVPDGGRAAQVPVLQVAWDF